MMSFCKVTASTDIVVRDNGYVSLSTEPWLDVVNEDIVRMAGHFVEITYHLSYWDDPVRPIFRFETESGAFTDHIAPAPVAGAGIWIGRIPAKTRRLRVSPTDRAGAFAFKVASVRKRHWLALVSRGLYHAPRATRSVILTRLIGWAQESDSNLSWAVGSTRLSNYAAWHRKRGRPIDLAGLDAPRSRWEEAAPVHLWLRTTDDEAALGRTLDSVLAQAFPRWILHIIGTVPADLSDDPRVRHEHSVAPLQQGAGLVTSLRCGDILPPCALGAVHEKSCRHAEADIFYGDEEKVDATGRVVPLFKPGWSPILHRQRPFLGRSVFIRAAALNRLPPGVAERFILDGKIDPDARCEPGHVVPVRRILLRTTGEREEERPILAPRTSKQPSVAIIIPTRDQMIRLKRLLLSIQRHCGDCRPDLIIVDNDSSEPASTAYLETLRRQADTKIIHHPGPFNFSAMCNAGAAAATSDVLVFLNNDMEVVGDNWLHRLAAWASDEDVGAVGAKLTYPNGRLQHVGVLLGMGGSAGHFGSLARPDAVGWVGRNRVVHEVSAVTGACLAVEARKFWAIGGFDATHLPVELSDIDLCLRLAAKGWISIVDPTVHLVHEESASRGRATFRRLNRYEEERDHFINRWRHLLRGDPYFHPGLSLFDRNVALG